MPLTTMAHICIALPLGSLVPVHHPHPILCSHALHLNLPPAPWVEPLWHAVQPHAHNDTLQSAILLKWKIVIVSNAVVHPSGFGTCAWIIWSGSKLWSGEGCIPSTTIDLYSGLAEVWPLCHNQLLEHVH